MSFLDYTLVPGGTFVMCESISEFDANAPVEVETVPEADSAPEPEVIPEPETITDRLRKKVAADQSENMVLRILTDLNELYNGCVVNMINRDLSVSSPEDIAAVSSQINDDAEVITSVLIKMLQRLRAFGLVGCESSMRRAIVYAPIRDNLGFLIKNAAALERNGYGSVTVHRTTHPAFSQYDVQYIVNAAVNAPDLLEHELLTLSTFSQLTSSENPICTMFSDIMDLFNTMLTNYERRIRQEQTNSYTYQLNAIIKWEIPMDHDCAPCKENNESGYTAVYAKLINQISKIQRRVKLACYDIQVDILDHNDSSITVINKELYKCSVQLFNIFAITAIFLIACAYDAQCILDEKSTIKNWISDILKQYLR